MRLLIVVLLIISLSGCYTVVWLPNEEMPKSYHRNDFYDYEYYGEYYDYYNTPWWILTPINIYNPSESIFNKEQRDKNETTVRNQIGERISIDRTGSGRNSNDVTTTVTGNSNSTSQTNGGSKSANSNDDLSRTKSKSINDSGSIRNESGNRNSGNSRR
jgi:uncharacterized protein YceK